ncbi:MAG: hypothetical protein IT370_13855 [Deltaproteobacteria bacterium]|nr:hypothetical protein [Deltaproteobacteria bacterium]
MTAPLRALRQLDEVQHLRQLEGLDAGALFAGLAAEVAEPAPTTLEELGRQLDALRDVLAAIDAFAQKAMGIRLTHVLAAAPLPPQLRTLLKSTVLSYQHDLPLLRSRVAAALGRVEPATGAAVTADVMDAADRVLALRTDLRARLFVVAQDVAAARLPAATQAARSRALAQPERQRWAQAAIDLEQLAATPALLAHGTSAERLGLIAPPPDDPEPEPTRGSLLEID